MKQRSSEKGMALVITLMMLAIVPPWLSTSALIAS